MFRKLKALGLVLAAVCAMGVVMVSAAQAKPWHLTAENTNKAGHPVEHAILHGTQASHAAGTKFVFTAGEGFGGISCSEVKGNGTLTTGTVQIVAIIFVFSKCADSFGRTVDVADNGCSFQFEVTSGSDPGPYSGDTDLSCPAGKTIEFKITSGGSTICTAKVGAQMGIGPIKFINDQDASVPVRTDVTFTWEANNVKNTTEGGFFNCGISNGEHTAGTCVWNTTVQASDTASSLLDLRIHTKK